MDDHQPPANRLEADAANLRATQTALRESEEEYRTLFETIGQGYAECEMIRDAEGRAINYRFIKVNPAFERLTGISAADAEGRTIREVVPAIEDWWIEAYDKIVRDGKPGYIEHEAASLGRWYGVHGYPRGGDRFVAMYEEVTDRKHAEAALRDSEERQAFLLRLSDALGQLTNPLEVKTTAMKLLAEQLDVMRASYFEFEEDEDHFLVTERSERDAPPIPERMRMSDFSPAMHRLFQSGGTLSIENATVPGEFVPDPAAYAAISVQALAGVGLLRGGRLVACTGVHSRSPRHWTAAELRYLTEVAERTWSAVEQARAEAALRNREERLTVELEASARLQQLSAEMIPAQDVRGLYGKLLEAATVTMHAQAATMQVYDKEAEALRLLAHDGLTTESADRWAVIDALSNTACGPALRNNRRMVIADVDAQNWPEENLQPYRASGMRSAQSTPLISRDGQMLGMISTLWAEPHEPAETELRHFDILARQAADLLERARAEAALRESEERQNFLLRLSDALGPLADPVAIQGEAARLLGEQVKADRTYYSELNEAEGVAVVAIDYVRGDAPSVVGRHPYDFYAPIVEDARSGRTAAEPDVAANTRLSEIDREAIKALRIGSYLNVPLLKAGRLVAILTVSDVQPRHWTDSEIAFVRETAERTWSAVERARAEAALRESEERLRQFGEASQDVLWIRDAKTLDWTYLTPAFEDIYGLSRDEALHGDTYRNWLALIVPEDRDHVQEMIDRVLSGEHLTFEYRIRRPLDGEVRWLRNTDFPIRDSAGRIASCGGIGQDVTLAKAAEERLTNSEERLRSAAEVARFALWDWDVQTGRVAWSDEHYRMQGYEVGEVPPSYEAWLARVHPEDRAEAQAQIARARDQRSEYVHEFRSLHPDGSVHWLSARARFFYDAAGRPIRMVGAMLETTERREWEDRQRVLLAELQHRVRNILAVIRSIVRRTDDGERSAMDYVQHLEGRISALARTQVLLTRHAGASVDLEDMIRDELLAQVASDDQIEIEGPDVELSAKAAEVLTLAIHELATNATKYGAFSRKGGRVHIHWEVEARDTQKWLKLEWQETGVPVIDAAPRRRGFGSELISRRIPYELKGRASFRLEPGGLRSHIEFPLTKGDSILQTDGVP